MRKILTILSIGMLITIGFASVALGGDDDPNGTNRPPSAPIIMQDVSGWNKETYTCTFYSTDPDGDQVYYDVDWEKICDDVVPCGDDDPVTPWLGPFNSGEPIDVDHMFTEKGTYKVTLTAKDEHGSVSQSTETTITYTKSTAKMLNRPIFARLLERFPAIFNIFKESLKL